MIHFLMKKIKRKLRRVLFITLMLTAAAGAGMFGAIMPTYRRQDDLTTKIEMVEVGQKEEKDTEDQEVKG